MLVKVVAERFMTSVGEGAGLQMEGAKERRSDRKRRRAGQAASRRGEGARGQQRTLKKGCDCKGAGD